MTERYVENSVDFIRRSNANGNRFFLYFAQMHVHLPLYAAERFVSVGKLETVRKDNWKLHFYKNDK
ncbi:MAG: hypothetical protein FWD71_08165 [Oscillospiraceae bacterium]|nr:hypothetical protein [Oscillospiraceae bacterium]